MLKIACLAAAGLALALPASAEDVAAALKGKLIEVKDGEVQDATIPDNMEYYVLYHSASW
ncbi:MAG: hypothetical protein AAF585_24845 [Verrucomicrobiota bacterium]